MGTKIYFFDKYENLQSGTIVKEHDDYVDVDLTIGGSITVKKDDCFLTEKECILHKSKQNQERKNKIKKDIKTKDDLILFALDNCIAPAEEYTDWVAREAFIERIVELGIKIPD